MEKSSKKSLLIITLITAIFLVAVAFDLSKYLRGPDESLVPSRWPYYFVNTLSRLWAPMLVGIAIVVFFYFIEKVQTLKKSHELMMLALFIVLIFFFQLSLVYFSRFGVRVLFRRIADPGINGYFSTAMKIKDTKAFLQNFPTHVLKQDMHATSHPPGGVLLMRSAIFLLQQNPRLTDMLYSRIPVPTGDAKELWLKHDKAGRVGAVVLSFLLHLTAGLTLIPFYYLIKTVSEDRIIALRSTLLYSLSPSFSFFALTLEPIYTVFPFLGCLLLALGIKKKKELFIFLSGTVFGAGTFFSYSFLPVLVFLFVLGIILIPKVGMRILFSTLKWFLTGILTPLGLLFLAGFNSISAFLVVVGNLFPRSYLPYLFYNPYDFFVFAGLPISLLFLGMTYRFMRRRKNLKQIENKFLISFWFTFILVVVLGISRGEVGRIWLPFMFIPITLGTFFATKDLKLKTSGFILILALTIMEVAVIEEFWVPVW